MILAVQIKAKKWDAHRFKVCLGVSENTTAFRKENTTICSRNMT
jgi:hypothetical protein